MKFIQATQYPHITEIVLNPIEFDWQDRPTIDYISKKMKEEKMIYCYPLLVFQLTALEKCDKEIIAQSNSEGTDFAETVTPKNDGANSCGFISIGIIDNLVQVNSKSFVKELHIDLNVDSIKNYAQSFKSFRDTTRLYDTYETYEII